MTRSEPRNLPSSPLDPAVGWGSDVIASTLRDLGIDLIALNPGASFRGLHDSLVNHLGNESPHMLLCLHEEHAVAIAHGYAKVTGEPMAVALHTNVGLMHASMALFNAYCDRVPVVVVGSNGPLDAQLRRPWIDWIHTVADPGDMVRGHLKWDDQPGSIDAAVESLARAHWIARTGPPGPVLVSVDVELQESELPPDTPVVRASPPPVHDPVPASPSLAALHDALSGAQRPVVILGRGSRSRRAWDARVSMVERLSARVITDLRAGASFPTEHPLHVGFPGLTLSTEAKRCLEEADVVLALDPVDLAGMLREAGVLTGSSQQVFTVSLDPYVHNGWSKDHQRFVVDGTHLLGDPDGTVALLLDSLDSTARTRPRDEQQAAAASDVRFGSLQNVEERPLGIRDVAMALRTGLGSAKRPSYIRLPLGWPGDALEFDDPLDFLGSDGGAGIGSGPGMAVGAAWALRDLDRFPVAILGDGDFLMGCTALWTAVSEGIPLLVLLMNNRSYLNDELHQIRVARQRSRSEANRWVGQQIDDPPVDLSAMAEAQGAVGYGPVTSLEELRQILPEAVTRVEEGALVVVDVLVRSDFEAGSVTQMVVPS